MMDKFDSLVEEALEATFSGWDFSYLQGRYLEEKPSWDYRQRIESRLANVTALLDMGTGGGEFLASLSALPPRTCATESYLPNIPVAKARLEPLGVQVVPLTDDAQLPFPDNSFDLIINRHDSYSASELFRVLRQNGRFLTQQVGGEDNLGLNCWLVKEAKHQYEAWFLANEVPNLEQQGFDIEEQLEEFPKTFFNDIGAVVYYLKAIPWQIPDFDPHTHRDQLQKLHAHIVENGRFAVQSHRFYIEAVKR